MGDLNIPPAPRISTLNCGTITVSSKPHDASAWSPSTSISGCWATCIVMISPDSFSRMKPTISSRPRIGSRSPYTLVP